ncbi:hypothetical protein [Candidatus Magnetominusculus xianensis]|uniref:Secreted protein n=1 Tax=Candidatus Magnetominusculus xianensis TaxID=1748249 RepID=A0ABR5SKI3_9BACT|nr:hypothetical protein [Candidatus Magnetominusculus xianensis]KWT87252.1 hypothetical protein ASN18_1368 [Candidatus Magnetominusculus xianensis]MBF0405049.1 hypothetical protein [Nitrospirota bacterium]
MESFMMGLQILTGEEGILTIAVRLSAVVILTCLLVSLLSSPVNITYSMDKPVVCSLNICSPFGFKISNNVDMSFPYEPPFELTALNSTRFRYLINNLFKLSSTPVELYYPPEN